MNDDLPIPPAPQLDDNLIAAINKQTVVSEMRKTSLADRLVIPPELPRSVRILGRFVGVWIVENDAAVLWHLELQFQRVLSEHPERQLIWAEAMKHYLESK